MIKPISIFISYAHEDEEPLNELLKRLEYHVRRNTITVYTDKGIEPGDDWDKWIKEKLTGAGITLFLVSPDFIDSKYIHYTELKIANEKQGTLIPVIARPVILEQLEISSRKVLPKDGKPVTLWANKDEAWNNVGESLGNIFDRINGVKTRQPDTNTYVMAANTQNKILTAAKITDKVAIGFIMLMMTLSLVLFVLGINAYRNGANDYQFFIWGGTAVASISLFFYFFGRRSHAF